jgi:hypothetical protein
MPLIFADENLLNLRPSVKSADESPTLDRASNKGMRTKEFHPYSLVPHCLVNFPSDFVSSAPFCGQ